MEKVMTEKKFSGQPTKTKDSGGTRVIQPAPTKSGVNNNTQRQGNNTTTGSGGPRKPK